jgi:hypothetical protein
VTNGELRAAHAFRMRSAWNVIVERNPDFTNSVTGLVLKNPLNGSGGATKGARYAENERRQKHRRCGNLLGRAIAMPWLPRIILLTRVSPKPFDDDGLAAAFKSIRDGIAERLGIDDGSAAVTWLAMWRKGKPKEHTVVMEAWR